MRKLIALHLVALLAVLTAVAISRPMPAGVADSDSNAEDSFEELPGIVQVGLVTLFPGSDLTFGIIFIPKWQDPAVMSAEAPVGLFAGFKRVDVFLLGSFAGLPVSVVESFDLAGGLPPHRESEPASIVQSSSRPVAQESELSSKILAASGAKNWSDWHRYTSGFRLPEVQDAGTQP